MDAADGEFALVPDAALFDAVGFRPIPIDEIGPYDDAYRASSSARTTPVATPEWR